MSYLRAASFSLKMPLPDTSSTSLTLIFLPVLSLIFALVGCGWAALFLSELFNGFGYILFMFRDVVLPTLSLTTGFYVYSSRSAFSYE